MQADFDTATEGQQSRMERLTGAEEAASLAGEIRSRALKLLTNRDHSRLELERKLTARGYPPPAVQAVLDRLLGEGLLNEERLITAYISERLGKGFGPLRIRSELLGKGLSDTAISTYLDMDDDECLRLMTEADGAKFSDEAKQDPKTLAKRARFLEYRGFPTHLIARLLRTDC
jgi:regulatory protein